MTQPPSELHPQSPTLLSTIFSPGRMPTDTYVPPRELADITGKLNEPKYLGVVVHGPRTSGKTTAVKKAMGAAVVQAFRCPLKPEQVQALFALLDDIGSGKFKETLLLDDAHLLGKELQERLCDRLNQLVELEPQARMIFISVTNVHALWVKQQPGLQHKLAAIPIREQPQELVETLISQGAKAANVRFRHKDDFVKAAAGNFYVAQYLCLKAATHAIGWTVPTDKEREIDVGPDDEYIRTALENDYQARIKELERFIGKPPQEVEDNELLRELLHHDEERDTYLVIDPLLRTYLQRWKQDKLPIDDKGRLLRPHDPPPASVTAAGATSTPPASAAPPAPPPGRKTRRTYSDSLVEALQKRRIVPFAGAGVSMALRDKTGNSLFPSWHGLLKLAASKLKREGLRVNALVVELLLHPKRRGGADYLGAAAEAAKSLDFGPWSSFLREVFNPKKTQVDQTSLELACLLWTLGSDLLVTTNFDDGLAWACEKDRGISPARWIIETPSQQLRLLEDGAVERPTVWHLHGHIDEPLNLILTPDEYSRLYPDKRVKREEYRAALDTLRTLLTTRTFLFVGFSFADEAFKAQLAWVNDVFKETKGKHYILVRERDRQIMEERMPSLRTLTFADYGEPLLEVLRDLAALVPGGGA